MAKMLRLPLCPVCKGEWLSALCHLPKDLWNELYRIPCLYDVFACADFQHPRGETSCQTYACGFDVMSMSKIFVSLETI